LFFQSRFDAAEVEVAVAEAEDGLAVALGLDLIDASAFFTGGVVAGVEDDAVAGLEGGFEAERNVVVGDAGHGAEEDAALGAEAAVGEFLVLDAVEPAGVEAAGERHREFVFGADGVEVHSLVLVATGVVFGEDFVEGLAVDARDAGDVFG
jgi:hypothetical protein